MRKLGLSAFAVLLIGSGLACDGSGNGPARATPGAPAAPAPTAEPNAAPAVANSQAAEILQATNAAYTEARSYRDTGTETKYVGLAPNEPMTAASENRFETRIVAPDTFRVDIHKGDDIDVYWNGGVPAEKAKHYTGIGSGIGSIHKVYEQSVENMFPVNDFTLVVPRLMLPFLLKGPLNKKPITRMENPRLDGEEVVDDQPCWKVIGTYQIKEATLWIDKQSHLIRKFRHASGTSATGSVAGGRSVTVHGGETIVTFHPELNPPLTPEDLTFTPPGG